MEKNCTKKECAHYIGKDRFQVYRHKFLWSIVICTVAVAILFVLLSKSYNRSLQQIVDIHKEFVSDFNSSLNSMTTCQDDSFYGDESLMRYLNEQMSSMNAVLQIQGGKIQSDFALLSIWAGVLMVVFLIFSIYSTYKTDEMIRQGKEGLRFVEEAKSKTDGYIETINFKVQNELNRVNNLADKKISAITQEAFEAQQQAIFSLDKKLNEYMNSIESRTNVFQGIYNEYVQKMDDATKRTNELFKLLIDTVRNQTIEDKEQQDNPSEKQR